MCKCYHVGICPGTRGNFHEEGIFFQLLTELIKQDIAEWFMEMWLSFVKKVTYLPKDIIVGKIDEVSCVAGYICFACDYDIIDFTSVVTFPRYFEELKCLLNRIFVRIANTNAHGNLR
jgi:FPC/CPF motif-containing protein YcgG